VRLAATEQGTLTLISLDLLQKHAI
jgi:hypothetical protein